MRRRAIAAVALLGLVAAAAPLALRSAPALIWNTTASAPVGLYRLESERDPKVGDWVAIRPPPPLASQLSAAGFLPLGALLLKQIAAIAPSAVCRVGERVSVDRRFAATALARDRWGRPLPVWRGCRRLMTGDVFLLNPEQRSLDSRYFGPLAARQIVGRAAPLLVWGRAADAH